MKCPNCCATGMAHDTRDVPHTYKGESVVLPQLVGDFCAACGESVADAAEARRVSALMRDFGDQVNAAMRQRPKALDK